MKNHDLLGMGAILLANFRESFPYCVFGTFEHFTDTFQRFAALPLCQWALTGYSLNRHLVNTLSQSAEQSGPWSTKPLILAPCASIHIDQIQTDYGIVGNGFRLVLNQAF